MDAVQKKLLPWLKSQCGFFSVNQPTNKDYKFLLLPRNSYFEAYKTYPLSVGRDIQKIAAIEGRQISPYKNDLESINQFFIFKQDDKFLVYYFVVHPKYIDSIEKSSPWLIVPESILVLLTLAKKGEENAGTIPDNYILDENGVWVSQINLEASGNTSVLPSTLIELAKPKWLIQVLSRFHNPQIIKQIASKFERWQQLKFLAVTCSVVGVYFLFISGYQTAINYYLTEKRAESAPIVSEIFNVKSESDRLKTQNEEYIKAYSSVSNKVSTLIFLESLKDTHQLVVNRLRFFGERVVLEGLATNANNLLSDLNANPSIIDPVIKGDIRKAGAGGRLETFSIEFHWRETVWQ